MNQTPLSIVTFGVDQNTARRVSDRLCARGINAESYVISNTATSDAEIANILTSKKWDGLIIGLGVQKDRPWFERIVEVVNKANPNLPLIHHQGPNDLEDAIKRHFKIQLRRILSSHVKNNSTIAKKKIFFILLFLLDVFIPSFCFLLSCARIGHTFYLRRSLSVHARFTVFSSSFICFSLVHIFIIHFWFDTMRGE
jgi:hypothetical protein